MQKVRGLLVAAAVVLGASVAQAQAPVDDATRGSVRVMGNQGIDAYEAGKYAEALEKLEGAYRVLKAPTLGLWSARAMAKLGKLVEASERYREVTRLKLEGGNPEILDRAKADANQELEALQPRVPNLTFEIRGAKADDVRVTVDGAAVPSSVLAAPRPVNPGRRVVQGKLGERAVTVEVVLAEGETKTAVLTFPEGAAEAPPAATGGRAARTTTVPAATQPRSGNRTLGWVSLGVGGVGVVVGTVAGIMTLGKKSTADDHCFPSLRACDQTGIDANDAGRTLGTVSTIGFVVGAVGLGVGTYFILTSGSGGKTETALLTQVGPGSTELSLVQRW